ETVTVRDDQLPSQPFYVLDLEDNYLPNVVLRENGAASFEALKAQAVAARSFTYHLVQNTSATFIRNSQADQVYSLGGIQGNPGGLWD
ncbi:MAG: SpoIID/LytB domain-containing protein, partial [Planctomycetota bacterium]